MDAHDLFRKLCKGIKFHNRVRPVGTPTVTKCKTNASQKVENAAEEWLNPISTIKSEEDSIHNGSIIDSISEDEADQDMLNNHDLPKSRQYQESHFQYFESRGGTDYDDHDLNTSKDKKKNRLSPEEKLKVQEEERVNLIRKRLHLSVSGGGIPGPVTSFQELQDRFKVSATLVGNLLKSGYCEPTPIQAQAWPIMIEKRQILACAPTGSGKTAAFLVPLLHHLRGLKHDGIRAVVVSPTRELAQQTYRESMRLAEGTGISITVINKIKKTSSKLNIAHTRKFDLLLTTPNRLVFLLNQEPPVLSLNKVEWLVVDESDKLFEAGPRGFRDQLAVIYQACDSQRVKRAMFSATHGVHVARWCRDNLKGVIAVTVGHRNTAADEVEQELVYVGNEHGKLLAMRNMITKGLQPPVLIFVQSKERAKDLLSELLYDGINVDVIHADRTQLQRDNVVRSFREGKIWVLICTELMGRGIDFKGVNLVINYDFPPSAVSYIHRIGRTGRAGRAGKAVTFFTDADSALLRCIATVMRDSGCDVPQYMLDMKKVNKTTRKKLESQAPARDRILTAPLSDIRKRERIKFRIENEKRIKKGLPPLLEMPSKGKSQKNSPMGVESKAKNLKKTPNTAISEDKVTQQKKKRNWDESTGENSDNLEKPSKHKKRSRKEFQTTMNASNNVIPKKDIRVKRSREIR